MTVLVFFRLTMVCGHLKLHRANGLDDVVKIGGFTACHECPLLERNYGPRHKQVVNVELVGRDLVDREFLGARDE